MIGNNIANANTVGAKAARAEFADVYANAHRRQRQRRRHRRHASPTVAQQFTQGNITTTDNPLDLAINGNGFFEVSKGGTVELHAQRPVQGRPRRLHRQRPAQQLMGYPADATGTIIPGAAGPLQMPTGGITPAVTTKIGMEMNLDARLGVTLPAPARRSTSPTRRPTTTRPR